MRDLFEAAGVEFAQRVEFAPGAVWLHGFAASAAADLMAAIDSIAEQAPFRQMTTPGGFQMSVAMSNCGAGGWITDRKGYRYSSADPLSGAPWPVMPEVFDGLARRAAWAAGYDAFTPDACLINRYAPGARMSLHQDRNERDFSQPIVSVSLGLPATFQFGGDTRTGKVQRLPLRHGDVVVWGGASRLAFHGVSPLKAGEDPLLRNCRYNLTFRKAL